MLKMNRMLQRTALTLGVCVIGFLVIFFLSGCTLRTPGMNKLDSLTFSASLKADKNADYGKKAAYRDGRIYYLSAESGTQGIYSMNLQGEDIVLEIPVEDIRSIKVTPDGIYYSGFACILQNDNGPYRQFRLFQLQNGGNEPVDLLKTFSIQDKLGDENVWDFFLTENGTFAVRFVNVTGYPPRPVFPVACFKDSNGIALAEYSVLVDGLKVSPTAANQNTLSLSSLDGLYFLSFNINHEKYSQKQLRDAIYHIGFYDALKGQTIPPIDRYNAITGSYGDIFWRYFCRIEENEIILSSNIGLQNYHLTTRELTETVTFEAPETVYQSNDIADKILVFTERFRGAFLLDEIADKVFHQNRALQETLYRFDPDTGEIVRLLNVGRNHAFLYADAKTAITGGGKIISIYDISGDKAVLLRAIEIDHNIVDRANKVDTAGGWLFLYRFNVQTQRDELIEKIYIGS